MGTHKPQAADFAHPKVAVAVEQPAPGESLSQMSPLRKENPNDRLPRPDEKRADPSAPSAG